MTPTQARTLTREIQGRFQQAGKYFGTEAFERYAEMFVEFEFGTAKRIVTETLREPGLPPDDAHFRRRLRAECRQVTGDAARYKPPEDLRSAEERRHVFENGILEGASGWFAHFAKERFKKREGATP